jgi:hypothetical protein
MRMRSGERLESKNMNATGEFRLNAMVRVQEHPRRVFASTLYRRWSVEAKAVGRRAKEGSRSTSVSPCQYYSILRQLGFFKAVEQRLDRRKRRKVEKWKRKPAFTVYEVVEILSAIGGVNKGSELHSDELLKMNDAS